MLVVLVWLVGGAGAQSLGGVRAAPWGPSRPRTPCNGSLLLTDAAGRLLAAAGQTNLSLRLASLAVTDCSCWAVSSRPAGAGSRYILHGPARVTAAEVGFSQVATTARLRT